MCKVRKTKPFKNIVTAGDNFYHPDSVATATNYYQPEACLLAYPGHTWRATYGNHDVAGDSTATVLGAKQRFYTWSEANAEFFMLDSNQVADPGKTAWLEASLRQSKAPVKIVVFHHAAYTVGGHEDNLEVQKRWVPLFERHDVALVITGHSHDYQHSIVNNIDYLVTGGGGAQIYPCFRQPPTLVKCLAVHHFVLVDTAGPKVTVTALDESGAQIDKFQAAY